MFSFTIIENNQQKMKEKRDEKISRWTRLGMVINLPKRRKTK